MIALAVLLAGCAGVAVWSPGPSRDGPAAGGEVSGDADAAPPAPSTSPLPTPPPIELATAMPDVTIVDDRDQVVTIRDGIVGPPAPGIIGIAGRSRVGTKGNVVVRAPFDGPPFGVGIEGPIGERVSSGQLVPLVTDRAEDWVALGPAPGVPADGTIAPGRTATEIVLASPDGDVIGVELAANLVPEAFSLEPEDGTAPWLYVVEYLPAEAPTHYRVRLLDPNTGELSWPLNLRDKTSTVDSQMAGVSRDQVLATDRALLFTLYRGHHGAEGHDYAFVHVLSMWGGVLCLEVPVELELATRPGVIAVSPDESMLYAVAANGSVAEYVIGDVIDPQRTPLARRTVRTSDGGEARPAAVVTDDHVVVARIAPSRMRHALPDRARDRFGPRPQ